MKIIIVGHHSREEWVTQLQRAVFASHTIVDYADSGALAGHRSALELASQYDERCIIMEDDAIPVVDFALHAQRWFDEFPDSLISFYLGTGRPFEWQRWIDGAIGKAEVGGKDYIECNGLFHGLCYSIPPNEVKRVLENLKHPEADFAIGRAWGREVIYPVESLVEHRDGVPVERHPDGETRTEIRVARKLAGPLLFDR